MKAMIKKIVCLVGISCAGTVMATNANAVLIGTNGSVSSAGGVASIIAAPPDVNDDAAFNDAIQAFNEIIGHVLTADLSVDGGIISKGTRVDSHMIFLNSGPGNSGALVEHGAGGNRNTATFTFDGDILGVMSDGPGALEVASSPFLGAIGTLYPVAAFAARGLEGNPSDGRRNDDWYEALGSTISLGMRVTEPGDWIRVVTVSTVPIPAALPLLGGGLAALGFFGWRRNRASAAA